MSYSNLHKDKIIKALTNLNEDLKKIVLQGMSSKYLVDNLKKNCLSLCENLEAVCTCPNPEDDLLKLYEQQVKLPGTLAPLPAVMWIAHCFNELLILEETDKLCIFQNQDCRDLAISTIELVERSK